MGSNPILAAIAPVVQWIRILDYESRDSSSNLLGSTKHGRVAEMVLGSALQKLLRQFESDLDLKQKRDVD